MMSDVEGAIGVMATLLGGYFDGLPGLVFAAILRRLEVSPRYYFAGLAILVALLIFALVKAYGMWEEIHDVEEPDSPSDLLETFEEAHAAGELDDAEFERVRRRLSGQSTGEDPSPPPPAPDEKVPDRP